MKKMPCWRWPTRCSSNRAVEGKTVPCTSLSEMDDVKRSIQAVIFDLDGVLVDTEPLVVRAWQEILVPFGRPLDEQDIYYIMGIDEETTNRYILEKTGLPMDLETSTRIHRQHLARLFAQELRLAEGAQALLESLAGRGLALAIASNSRAEYVDQMLQDMGLRPYFQALATREHATHGKPAPDLYLAAARLLGVPPQACLAVEDSAVGLQAAVAAGMGCLVIAPADGVAQDFSLALARAGSLPELAHEMEKFL